MFSAQGYRWKRLRTISSPTFSSNNLRKVTGTVEECTLELLKHIEEHTSDGQQIDMLNFYQEFTLDVIGRIAMGQNESLMFKNPLLPHVKAIFGESRTKLMMLGAVSPFMIDVLKWFMSRRKNNGNAIMITVERAVRKRMEERSKDENYSEEPQDFIDLFLDAKSDDVDLLNNNYSEGYSIKNSHQKISKTLTMDEIIAQCMVFIIAGFDTTALSLSFTTFLLATHPEIQKKLQEEVDRECPDPEISFDQLSKLKYLECVMKETLRLYPLASGANSRTCMKETTIGDGIRIEKGTHVLANTWAIHTNPTIWGEDSDEFKPERWESGDEHFFQKGGYIPFGLGPRQCIGMRLAYMEEKMLLAHILRRYSFEIGEKTVIPMKLVGRATTQPTSVWMHLVERN
uniref:Cytochrome P450 n=1 Tax=Caenorhabditis tropicalis TaxID=1561998 RepID=A0A1I7TA15_9PELO